MLVRGETGRVSFSHVVLFISERYRGTVSYVGIEGLDVNLFKVLMLLYADDIVIFSNTAEELQSSLDL